MHFTQLLLDALDYVPLDGDLVPLRRLDAGQQAEAVVREAEEALTAARALMQAADPAVCEVLRRDMLLEAADTIQAAYDLFALMGEDPQPYIDLVHDKNYDRGRYE